MKIAVKQEPSTYPVEVEVLEHDCYEADDYTIEKYTYYSPTPQQIDEGTDRDETGYMAVCNRCGADMPNIDVNAEMEEEGWDCE